MLKNLFKLEKLKIHAFMDAKRSGPGETFEAMFNPESYSLKYENKFQRGQGVNTSGRQAKYSMNKPGKLTLKLILDDTGVSRLGARGSDEKERDVYKKVHEFLELTSYMDGEIHEPKYLKVEWGDLIFNCRLESVNVAYSMFNRAGQPIRAELDTVFIGDIEDSKRLKKENKASPDLTRVRTVKSGDRLPLMAGRQYGDPAYYIQVARANKLNNFRKLKPGDGICFPPVEK